MRLVLRKKTAAADCDDKAAAYDACIKANGRVSVGEPCYVYTCQGLCAPLGCAECQEDTDCEPTETCDIGTCRKRYLSDADCPGAYCFAQRTCAEPVGTPCSTDELSDCGGGQCINVDANLTTVESYCTMSCDSLSSACPEGYTCQDYECRRL